MAGDEDRPSDTQASAPVPPSPPAAPLAPDPLTGPPGQDAIPAREPSMGAAGADDAPAAEPDRRANHLPAGSASTEPAPRRSILPGLLGLIGLVLIGLLVANLYALYNPPANEAVPALLGDVAGLKQRLATVEQRPQADTGPLEARVVALSAALDELKGAVGRNASTAAAGEQAQAAVAPLDGRVTDLAKRVDALDGQVAALPRVDLAPVTAALDAMSKRLVPLESYFNAPKATTQVTEARQNGSAAQTRAAPLAILAQAILADLPAGRPFEPEARALGALGVDPATLQPLQAVAATGAASDADLRAGFAAIGQAAVAAAAPVSTGTLLDRWVSNAQSLVKVSRTGAASGDAADAVAARIGTALDRGDLPAAAAAWDQLPDASRARSADWAARLKARLGASAAAQAIQSQAVAALSAATPTP